MCNMADEDNDDDDYITTLMTMRILMMMIKGLSCFLWSADGGDSYGNFLVSFFSMKIVKEHNEMTTALDEKKKSLMEQLDMV